MHDSKWIGLAYVIPATPSKGRVFVWRHLKSMGAKIIKPGLAALPNNPQNVKRFSLLAEKIESFMGQASLLEFNFLLEKENTLLEEEFSIGGEMSYDAMLDKCRGIIEDINKSSEKSEKKLLEEKLLSTIRNYDKMNDTSLLATIRKDMGDAAGELLSALKTLPAEIISALKK